MDRFQMCQLSNVSGWPFAEANLSSEVSTFSQPDYDLGQGNKFQLVQLFLLSF